MKNNFEQSNILTQFKKLNLGCHEKSWQSRNTYRKSTQRILKFCYENYNVQKIENIQNKHIRAYIESQEEKSLSALKKEMSGFRYYINLLNNINMSRDRKECKFNLTNKDLGINGSKEFNARTAITMEELNSIFDKIDEIKSDEVRTVIRTGTYLGAYFGLRSKEIFCLKVGQIKDVIYQISEGGQVYLKLDGEGCKGGRPRSIVLSKKQQQILLEIYKDTCEGKYVDDYVLRDRNIEGSLQKRLTIWHNFYSRIGYEVSCEKRKERPPYDDHVSAHSLRRFFAVNLYKKLRKNELSHEKAFSIVSSNLGHGKNRFQLSKCYLNELL